MADFVITRAILNRPWQGYFIFVMNKEAVRDRLHGLC